MTHAAVGDALADMPLFLEPDQAVTVPLEQTYNALSTRAMTGLSIEAAVAIARQFPWERYASFADIGTAQGALPVEFYFKEIVAA